MKTAEEISTMSIEEVEMDFYDLMDDIITTYGDGDSVVCPGKGDTPLLLPSDKSVPVWSGLSTGLQLDGTCTHQEGTYGPL